MENIYSRYLKDKLLHVVNRLSEITEKRVDLCPENQFLQVATLNLPKGQTFKAHQHLWRKGEDNIIPQESWVIIKGSVRFFYYDLNKELIGTTILNAGDCSITFEGGHTYEILEEGTIVYEMKSAVYYGQQADKVFI